MESIMGWTDLTLEGEGLAELLLSALWQNS